MSSQRSGAEMVHLTSLYQLNGKPVLDAQVADEVKEEAWKKITAEMSQVKTGVDINQIKDQMKKMQKTNSSHKPIAPGTVRPSINMRFPTLTPLKSKSEPKPSVSKQGKSPPPLDNDDQPEPSTSKKRKPSPPLNGEDQTESVSEKRKSSPRAHDEEYPRLDLFDCTGKYMADVLRLYPRTLAMEAHGKIMEALQNQIVLLEEKLQSEEHA